MNNIRNLADVHLWIFDMDDTLYPERTFALGGYAAVSKKTEMDFGTAIEDALLARFHRGERANIFELALKDKGIDASEDYVQTLVRTYREHTPVLAPYPDVQPFLESLRSQSKKLALLTDGLADIQRRKWHALGLASLFDFTVFTESLRGRDSWKPSPDGFLHALANLRIAARHAVYIGDDPIKDFHAPRALGMKSIRIVRPDAQHRDRAPADPTFEPDFSITSLSELR